MKNNESFQTYIIKNHFNLLRRKTGCYNMAISCQIMRQHYNNITYPIIIKGNLKEKGSKFIIKRKDLNLFLFYEIIEIIMTDYYIYIKYHIYKTIPESNEYDFFLAINYLNEDECVFFIHFVFDHRIYLSEKEVHEEIKSRKSLFKKLERSLKDYEFLKISTVFTTINCKIELIWDIVKNMKIIHKYSHLLCDKINYKGDILKKDVIIRLMNVHGKSASETTALVTKLKMIKSEIIKEGTIELLFQEEKNSFPSSYSKIVIKIYEYGERCTIYILYFFFTIQMNFKKFFLFKKNKEKELAKFKQIIENYNENNNIKFNGKDIYNFENSCNFNKK